ncbi:MAG: RES domain-containing protein [Betaproteobacteria bacterium]|nr:RES domain-containing protein [Betaproteobacteria bacterium]
MRRAYRIVKRRQARFAFSGEGARLAGGRWSSPGIHAVYLSSTLSLAALEIFVHLGDDAARLDFVYFEVGIPASLPVTTLTRRPKGWRDEPPTNASMCLGDRWLRAGTAALLQVPSAIVPSESNLILNPRHPDSARLRIAAARVFQFDPRMWK